jgi:TolB-like protein/cytochrome c-type biogenesis protein CcmH/NrfG
VNPDGLVERLKQRKVVQWALAYVAFWFALLQGLDIVASRFDWPDAIERYFILALAIGFCVTLVLAWYHGERGTQRVSSTELLIIALLLAIGGGLVWRFGPTAAYRAHALAAPTRSPPGAIPAPEVAAPARVAAFNPPAASIVVLPFRNLSGDPEQAYFSNGITEELTDALGQNTGLTVIAWDTASRYSTGKQPPAEIGKALNVAHIVDGSIQRDGDQVRVSVELVSTVTGRQLWSAHYDDSFRNIFAVQDKITAAVADALKVKFAAMQGAPTQNPEAHQLYLKGLAAMDRFTAADTQAAQDYFQQAVQLDPGYADAWAELAKTYVQLTEVSTLPLQEALPKIRAAARKALALDPHNVNALVALGNADENDNRIAKAKAELEQALALDPSNAAAHDVYGNVLPVGQALAQSQEAARLDPDSAEVQVSLASYYQDLSNWPQVVAASLALNRLSPHGIGAAFYLAFAYAEMQRGEDAVKAFDLAQPSTALDRQLIEAGRLTYQTLLEPTLRPKTLAALANLSHAKLNPFSQSSLMQLYLALGEKETAMSMLPGLCAAAPIACNDLAINPEFITPLHGDPRFEKLAKQYTTITRDPAPASAVSASSR